MATASFAKVEATTHALFAMVNQPQVFFLTAVAADICDQTKQVSNAIDRSRGHHNVDLTMRECLQQKKAFGFIEYLVERVHDDETAVEFGNLSMKNISQSFERWEDVSPGMGIIQFFKFFADIRPYLENLLDESCDEIAN